MLVHIWSNSEKTQLTIQMLCQHWAEKWEPGNIQMVRFLFWLSAHQPESQLSNGGTWMQGCQGPFLKRGMNE